MQRNAARLKDLQTSRTRLLSQKNANQTYLKELSDSNDKSTQKSLEQVYKMAIESNRRSGLGKVNRSNRKTHKRTHKI